MKKQEGAARRLSPRIQARLQRELLAQEYSTALVMFLVTGLNYNTLLYWVRSKLLRASIQCEGKQWTLVLFSFSDLIEIKLVQAMRERGASTKRIRKALAFLRKELKGQPLADLYLNATSEDIAVVVSPAEIVAAHKGVGAPLLVNLGWLESELNDKIEARTVTHERRRVVAASHVHNETLEPVHV